MTDPSAAMQMRTIPTIVEMKAEWKIDNFTGIQAFLTSNDLLLSDWIEHKPSNTKLRLALGPVGDQSGQPVAKRERIGNSNQPPVVSSVTKSSFVPLRDVPRCSRRVTLQRGLAGFGMTIIDDECQRIYISHIWPGGPADESGLLHKGDQLLEINGVDMRKGSHALAVSALRQSSSTVTILAQYKPEDFRKIEAEREEVHQRWLARQSSYSKLPTCEEVQIGYPRTITLQKGIAGLGINIVGGTDEKIYIFCIRPGSVAAESGLLRKGDQLLEVNGVDLRNASHDEAAAALKHSGPNVELVVQYSPEGLHKFEEKIEEQRQGLLSNKLPSVKSPQSIELKVRRIKSWKTLFGKQFGLGVMLAENAAGCAGRERVSVAFRAYFRNQRGQVLVFDKTDTALKLQAGKAGRGWSFPRWLARRNLLNDGSLDLIVQLQFMPKRLAELTSFTIAANSSELPEKECRSRSAESSSTKQTVGAKAASSERSVWANRSAMLRLCELLFSD